MRTSYLVNLGNVNDIPLGQGACYIVKGAEIAVFRARDGKVSAIENRCPHRQGPLSEGVVGNGKVVCPLHGHKFDLASGKERKRVNVCAPSRSGNNMEKLSWIFPWAG